MDGELVQHLADFAQRAADLGEGAHALVLLPLVRLYQLDFELLHLLAQHGEVVERGRGLRP